ncbi:uncharacterized protein LOC111101571 [Crassostrea virginica]
MQCANEVMEGDTYASEIAMADNVDIEKIPDAVPRGVFKRITLPRDAKPIFITFDLETTDLIRGHVMPHITQLSANEIISGEKFNSYIFPKLPISQESTKVTGIYVNESGEFKVNGEEKKAVGIHGGLQDFFQLACTVSPCHTCCTQWKKI